MKQLITTYFMITKIISQGKKECTNKDRPSPINLIEGKNAIKNEFAKSINLNLAWDFKAGDPNAKMEVKFGSGKGTVSLPNYWMTSVSYKGLREGEPIGEDWKPTAIHFKQPAEHIISNGSSGTNVLELQIVHKLKKPSKEQTEHFPDQHKNYSRLVISVLQQVVDTVANTFAKQGDPFLQSLGVSAKFFNGAKVLSDPDWQETQLQTQPNYVQDGKKFGDLHPDFADVKNKSYNRQVHRYLMQNLVNDNDAFMYYGSSTHDGPACPENTIYQVLKRPRVISIEQDLFLKIMLLKNNGKKLKEVGFKTLPEVSQTGGADKLELGTGWFLNFDAALDPPKFDVEQVNNINQAKTGPFQDVGHAINIKSEKILSIEIS